MDINRLTQISDYAWQVVRHGPMRVPATIFGDRTLLEAMDDKV